MTGHLSVCPVVPDGPRAASDDKHPWNNSTDWRVDWTILVSTIHISILYGMLTFGFRVSRKIVLLMVWTVPLSEIISS